MATSSNQISRLREAITNLAAQSPQKRLLLTLAVAGVVSSTVWCINDYREFLSLGRGGPPYNVLGWAMITVVRQLGISKRRALSPRDFPESGGHKEVQNLPSRRGDRALVKGIAPHRQMSQAPAEEMRSKIQSLFARAAEKYPDLVYIKKSLYERHNDALFVRDALLSTSSDTVPETARISRGEIGHMHGDMSVHLYVSPADARLAVEKGWAERHQLARPRPLFGRYLFNIGPTYLLFYGPRDDGELSVFATFLQSSIRFMTGREDVQLTEG